MAKLTRKQLDEEIKLRFLEGVKEHLENCGEEVLMVKSNEIAMPVVDSEGEERWLVLTFKVPTGSRETGEPYDGYSEAEGYQMDLAKRAEKAKAKEAEVAKKKAKAEAKAKGKAEESKCAKYSTCVHMNCSFEELKKSFPSFDSTDYQQLKKQVCEYCQQLENEKEERLRLFGAH